MKRAARRGLGEGPGACAWELGSSKGRLELKGGGRYAPATDSQRP